MSKKIFCAALVLFLAAATGAFAQASSFQGSCSNIAFAYQGSQPAVTATCVKADGSPNATSLVLQGISNQNGRLVQGSGTSSFQQSCGNIQIVVSPDGNSVSLSAICRTSSGSGNVSTLPLNGITNQNGTLRQGG
jgi:uncharacterized protein YdeI (BOF family)